MYFQNEIREVQGYGEKPKNLQIKPQEIKLAEQLIATLSEDFNPAKYRDTFQERLRAANLWDPRAANVLWKMGGPSQLS